MAQVMKETVPEMKNGPQAETEAAGQAEEAGAEPVGGEAEAPEQSEAEDRGPSDYDHGDQAVASAPA